jgi:uncharacterized membrane protein
MEAKRTEEEIQAEARRRLRRWGFYCIALSPVVGIWFGALSTVFIGLASALVTVALGVYLGFGYMPFALRLRRWEQSRGR